MNKVISINNSFDFQGVTAPEFEERNHKIVEFNRIIDPNYKPLRYLPGCFDKFFTNRPQPTPMYENHNSVIGRWGDRVIKDNILYMKGCRFSKSKNVIENIIPMLEEGTFIGTSTRTPFIQLAENKKDNCIDVVEAALLHVSLVDFPADENMYFDNNFNIDDFIKQNENIILRKRATRIYFNI